MANELYNWLNGNRDYQKGVRLFEANGGSQVLLNLFKQGANSFTKPKLAEALAALRSAKADEQSSKPPQPSPADKLPQKSTSAPDGGSKPLLSEAHQEVPEEIERLKTERQRLYRLNDAQWFKLHPKLEKKLAGMACLAILSRRDMIKEISTKLDYYEKFGELPIEKPKESAEIRKKLTNARSNLCKHKKKGNEKKTAEYTALVDELTKEYEEVTGVV